MRFALSLLVCVFTASPLYAQDGDSNRVSTAIEHYVDANTLVVGSIALDPTWIDGVQQEVQRWRGEAGNEDQDAKAFDVAQAMVVGIHSAGAREAIVVFGIDDLTAGPLVLITTTGGDAEQKVLSVAKGLREMAGGNGPKMVVAGDGNGNVLVGSQATVDRYRKMKAAPRPDLLEPIANDRGEDASGTFVVAPGDDARRVIRELWPALPRPFDSLTGTLVADDVSHLVVRITQPPEWTVHVELVARTEDAASKLNVMSLTGYRLVVEKISQVQPQLGNFAKQAARLLRVEQGGGTLSLRIAHDNVAFAALANKVFVPAVQDARDRAQRMQRMKHMKQIALAMHNFHDVVKHCPAPAAIVDKEGKPLLSWRVAILPYLDQQALFNEFHLDEPWDSPHNLKLAKTVPAPYIDPSHPELAREGKSVFQLPVHPESAFPPTSDGEPKEVAVGGKKLYLAPGTELRQITDGLSNTIMVVETAPEDAVLWTKPADWEVDLAQAWEQLKGQGGKSTVAAFCDGSAHAWDHSEERMKEMLPKLITRSGKEVIER